MSRLYLSTWAIASATAGRSSGRSCCNRRSSRRNGAVGSARLVRLSFALERVGAKDQGHELVGIDCERTLDGLVRRLVVVQIAARDRQVDPLPGDRSVGIDNALECGARSLHVSPLERPLAERAQGGYVRRVKLEYPIPVPYRVGLPPRLQCAHCLAFERLDFGSVRGKVSHVCAVGLFQEAIPLTTAATALFDLAMRSSQAIPLRISSRLARRDASMSSERVPDVYSYSGAFE